MDTKFDTTIEQMLKSEMSKLRKAVDYIDKSEKSLSEYEQKYADLLIEYNNAIGTIKGIVGNQNGSKHEGKEVGNEKYLECLSKQIETLIEVNRIKLDISILLKQLGVAVENNYATEYLFEDKFPDQLFSLKKDFTLELEELKSKIIDKDAFQVIYYNGFYNDIVALKDYLTLLVEEFDEPIESNQEGHNFLNDKFSSLRDLVSRIVELNDKINDGGTTQTTENKSLSSKIEAIQLQLSSLEDVLNDVVGSNRTMEHSLNEKLSAQLLSQKQEFTSKAEELDNIHVNLELLHVKQEKIFQSQIEALKHELTSLKEELNKVDEVNQRRQVSLEENLSSELSSLSQELTSRFGELDNRIRENDTLQVEYEKSLLSKIDNLKKEISAMTAKLTLLESNQAKQDSLGNKFSEQISSLNKSIDLKLDVLDSKIHYNKISQVALQDLSKQLVSLKNSVTTKIDGLNNQIEKKQILFNKKNKSTQIGFVFLFIMILVLAIVTFFR